MLSSVENSKKHHVSHFNNHNSESKHDFYHFFKHFNTIFAFKKLQNFISGAPHFPYVRLCWIHFYLPMMTLWSLLTKSLLTFGIKHVLFQIWYQFGPRAMDYAWWQCIIKTNLWLLVAGFFKYTCCMVFIFDYENAICIFDILFFLYSLRPFS